VRPRKSKWPRSAPHSTLQNRTRDPPASAEGRPLSHGSRRMRCASAQCKMPARGGRPAQRARSPLGTGGTSWGSSVIAVFAVGRRFSCCTGILGPSWPRPAFFKCSEFSNVKYKFAQQRFECAYVSMSDTPVRIIVKASVVIAVRRAEISLAFGGNVVRSEKTKKRF